MMHLNWFSTAKQVWGECFLGCSWLTPTGWLCTVMITKQSPYCNYLYRAESEIRRVLLVRFFLRPHCCNFRQTRESPPVCVSEAERRSEICTVQTWINLCLRMKWLCTLPSGSWFAVSAFVVYCWMFACVKRERGVRYEWGWSGFILVNCTKPCQECVWVMLHHKIERRKCSLIFRTFSFFIIVKWYLNCE